MPSQPLEGIRILDLSQVLAGPYCTMFLGDLGAEVIKVERPGQGDDTRAWGPPFLAGESAYFLSVNRNKKSITINLKEPRGREIIKGLARKSDVLVHNFRPGIMERMDLDYETLKKENPGIIYCSISGFGPDGPYRERAGYDILIQGMGGIMSLTGEPEGEPMKVGVAIVDVTAGLYCLAGIMSALIYRARTGLGQKVDVALLDSMVAWLVNAGQNYLVSGQVPERWGNAHPNIVPYQAFKAKDAYFIVAIGNDAQFRKLCEIIGRPELAEDPRYITNADRVKNRAELINTLAVVFETRESEEWIEASLEAGLPCGPINTLDRVFKDPQVLHREMVVEVNHPSVGKVRLAGNPIKLSESPAMIKAHPPLLGEHTEEVLASLLGLKGEEIEGLRREGVI